MAYNNNKIAFLIGQWWNMIVYQMLVLHKKQSIVNNKIYEIKSLLVGYKNNINHYHYMGMGQVGVLFKRDRAERYDFWPRIGLFFFSFSLSYWKKREEGKENE